jgi:hypothetical protein
LLRLACVSDTFVSDAFVSDAFVSDAFVIDGDRTVQLAGSHTTELDTVPALHDGC